MYFITVVLYTYIQRSSRNLSQTDCIQTIRPTSIKQMYYQLNRPHQLRKNMLPHF